MAWVATQFGRLFLCFRYGKGAKGPSLCREALHVSSTREARAEAKRLAAKLQLEIDAGTFDYSAWFPNSVRLRRLGLKPKELPTRRGEGLGLTWNSVFVDEGHLIVTHSFGRYGRTRPKTTASRRKVQFGPRVRAQLVAQRRRVDLSSPHVFPNRAGAALNQRWMSQQMWRRVLERAEVPYRPIGQTRHTYAAMMLQRGAPLACLQRQMGHTTLQMLIRHYWRYMQAQDLQLDEMSRLERPAGAEKGDESSKILISWETVRQ